MCYGGMCYLSVDDLWDLFESLVLYQWQCDCVSESLECPSPPTCDLHAQSPCVDKFRDACDHDSSYPLDICSYCQSFDHEVNPCPYYDISNESYARLSAMIESRNE